jgi:hypothetical protein
MLVYMALAFRIPSMKRLWALKASKNTADNGEVAFIVGIG